MTDVFIAGGGPAGLAAAIAARLNGFDVTVADASKPPIDKACGEGLMPAGMTALRALGVSVPANDASPIAGIRFIDGELEAEAQWCKAMPCDSQSLGIRRMRLHQLLIDHANDLGVKILWNSPIKSFQEIKSRWLIGADGQNSRVRQWAGLAAMHHESHRFGFRRHYAMAPWSKQVEIHWGENCQIYITPVSASETNIAVLTNDQHLRLDDAIAQFPQLSERLHDAMPINSERGAVTASRKLRRVVRGNVALIGDASGSVDAITGDGLSLSFQQSIALAEAMAAGDLEAYQQAHSRLRRKPAFMSALLLALGRSPKLRRRVIRTFANNGSIFESLLAFHTGPNHSFSLVLKRASG